MTTRDTLNTTMNGGLDLWIGSGLHHFRLSIYGRSGFLIRIPFIGKAWSYPGGYSGRMGWGGVRQEHALGLED